MVAQNMLRTYDVKNEVFRKKIGFDDSFDGTKCLQLIEMPDLLLMCKYRNEQPLNIKNNDQPINLHEMLITVIFVSS